MSGVRDDKPLKLYRIRDRKTGKFSAGGMNPRFTKQGKSWLFSNLKLHLHQHIKYSNSPYKDCDIVEYEGYPVYEISVDDFIESNDELSKKAHRYNQSKDP